MKCCIDSIPFCIVGQTTQVIAAIGNITKNEIVTTNVKPWNTPNISGNFTIKRLCIHVTMAEIMIPPKILVSKVSIPAIAFNPVTFSTPFLN